MLNVIVDEDGFVYLGGERLTHSRAIQIAIDLTSGVQDSLNRSQKNNPAYYDSAAILRRMESPIGQALKALRKVF